MSPKRGFDAGQLRRNEPGGAGVEILFVPGRYVIGTRIVPGAASSAGIADRLRFSPFWMPKATGFDRIGIHVLTAQATGSTRLGIYESDLTGIPAKLLLDAGTIDSSTTGFKEITISQELQGQHLYWTCYVNNVGSIAFRCASDTAETSLGYAAGGDVNPHSEMLMTHAFAALPDPATSLSYGVNVIKHAVKLRVI